MQKGYSTIFIVLLGLLILAGSLVGGYYYYQQQKLKGITDFESCAKHYPVLLSYPGQCNTPDGRHFVQELSISEREKLKAEVPANKALEMKNEAEGKLYSGKNYSFKYPDNWLESQDIKGVDVYLVAPREGECAFQPCGGSDVGLSVVTLENPELNTIDEFVRVDKYDRFSLNKFVKDRDWLIDRTAPGAGSGQQEALISSGNLVVELTCKECDDQFMNEIIDSFKFLH